MNKKQAKTWLITGGAGFIGSHLAKELLKRGQKVVIFDNFSSSDGSLLKPVKKQVKIINGDVRDFAAVIKAVKGADYVLHHAALVSVPQSVKNPQLTKEINTDGTFNVLFAARMAKVKRVIFASSSAVYGNKAKTPNKESAKTNPNSPYAETKLQGEALCKMFYHFYGLECVILRYFNVFGAGQNPASPYAAVVAKFYDCLKADLPLTINGDGKQTRDFVFVDDVVKANLLAATKAKAGEVYNVSGGKAYTLLQLAAIMQKVTGKKANIIFAPQREGDIKKSSADITKIKKAGFKPSITLRRGLEIIFKQG